MDYFDGFEKVKTPSEWKEKLLASVKHPKAPPHNNHRKLPIALAAVLTLVILLSGTALAYALTGGAFFTQFFQNTLKSNKTDYSYMDTDQLKALGGTLGTVVDTNELKIELMDNVCSGNTVMLLFRVTAKQLDTVLIENGWSHRLDNYRFGGDAFTVDRGPATGFDKYIYSNEDLSLAPNQFYYMKLIIRTDKDRSGEKDFKSGEYGYEFSDFGSYPSESQGTMDVLYEGPWEFTINFNNGSEYSKAVNLSNTISIKDKKFIFTDAAVSPFALTLNFHCDGVDKSNDLDVTNILPQDVTVTLSDGKILAPNEYTTSSVNGNKATVRDFSVAMGGSIPTDDSTTWYGTYVIMFNVPVKANDIKAVTIGDNTIDLKSN